MLGVQSKRDAFCMCQSTYGEQNQGHNGESAQTSGGREAGLANWPGPQTNKKENIKTLVGGWRMGWSSFPLFFFHPQNYSIIGWKEFRRCYGFGILGKKTVTGLLVNFSSWCLQIILGGTVASSLLEKWLEDRGKGSSSLHVCRQYRCVLWGGLVRYLQPKPLKSRASLLPNLLSKAWVDSGIRGAGGQQWRFQDRTFLIWD